MATALGEPPIPPPSTHLGSGIYNIIKLHFWSQELQQKFTVHLDLALTSLYGDVQEK